MERKKIIVDCDAGVDDALALFMFISAHKHKKIDILGITCVNGNTIVENVVNNVFRILQVCDTLDIPVFKGAHSQLLTIENIKNKINTNFHGTDGFGDVCTDKPDTSRLQSEHAVCALHRILSENPGDVSIVCLGPLTNIALTIKVFPEFINYVKEFYIMGGNYSARGNVTPQAEFNFYVDPESVHIVLGSNYKPLWLLPWETCLKSEISHDWRENVFGKINTPWVKLLNKIEDGMPLLKQLPVYTPCDAFVAGVLLRSDMIKNVVKYHADIELNGNKTRGQVVLNHLTFDESNVNIIKDVDYDIFKELLLFAADPTNNPVEMLFDENCC